MSEIREHPEGAEKFRFAETKTVLQTPPATGPIQDSSLAELRKQTETRDQQNLSEIREQIASLPDEERAEQKVENVNEIFARDRLLARAMSPLTLSSDRGKLYYDPYVWDEEVRLMREHDMKHTSCTLLIPGKGISTYKPYGLLMDGDKSVIEHVAEKDSVSKADNEGNLLANPSDIKTLDELADRIKSNPSLSMNEINAEFTDQSVVGVFVTNAPSHRMNLEAIIAQKHLHDIGINIPIFKYDNNSGSVESWQPTTEEIQTFIAVERNLKIKDLYSEMFSEQ